MLTEELVKGFESEFNGKYESMTAEDLSRYYYSFRKYGH